MLDWNDYRRELKGRIGELGKLSPDTLKGYITLSGAGAGCGGCARVRLASLQIVVPAYAAGDFQTVIPACAGMTA